MLRIPQDQMNAFDKKADEHLCQRLMKHLKLRLADRVPPPDPELHQTVLDWIGDARAWGLRSDSAITDYVTFCARQFGHKEPIESRLEVYLRINHEQLIEGVDLKAFCPATVSFAHKHAVLADEGVAWLAVILLAGIDRLDTQTDWIEAILTANHTDAQDEEARMHAVHRQAIARGWIAARSV